MPRLRSGRYWYHTANPSPDFIFRVHSFPTFVLEYSLIYIAFSLYAVLILPPNYKKKRI